MTQFQPRYKGALLKSTSGVHEQAKFAQEALLGPMSGGWIGLGLKALALSKVAGKALKNLGKGLSAFPAQPAPVSTSSAAPGSPALEPSTAGVEGPEQNAAPVSVQRSGIANDIVASLLGADELNDLEDAVAQGGTRRRDTFAINPVMLAVAAKLGEKAMKRDTIGDLAALFANDPLYALTRPCPTTGVGPDCLSGSDGYAEALLAGGILDSLKKVVKKVAPTVSKVAGKIANVASMVPIPGIATAVEKVAGTVKKVADKVVSVGGKAVDKVGSALGLTTAKTAALSDGVSSTGSLTGQTVSQTAERAREVADLASQAVPPAIYGDPVCSGDAFTAEDSARVREILSAVTMPGVVIADQFQVPPVEDPLAGEAQADQLMAAAAAAPEDQASGAPAPVVASAEFRQVPSDAVATGPGGQVGLSRDAADLSEQLTSTTKNGVPLFERAFDNFKAFDERALASAFPGSGAWVVPTFLERENPGIELADGKYALSNKEVDAVARWQSWRWQNKPRRATGDLLESALGAAALTALVREAPSEGSKDRASALAGMLLSMTIPTPEAREDWEAKLTAQKAGTLSPEEAGELSRLIGEGLLLGRALINAFTTDSKADLKGPSKLENARDWNDASGKKTYSLTKGAQLSPAVILVLREVTSLLAGAISDKELKSNAGLVRDFIKKYANSAGERAKLRVPSDTVAEDFGFDLAAPSDSEVTAITDEDDQAWRENRTWLQRVGDKLEDPKLNGILTALGFSAAAVPLVARALKARDAKDDSPAAPTGSLYDLAQRKEVPSEAHPGFVTLPEAAAMGWRIVEGGGS